jgi:TRAP transporter TAXI family solute receptor
VVARDDSGIKTIYDLKGKRVNTGAVGSGTEAMSNVVMDMYGWKSSDFSLDSKLGNAEMARGLCDNKFDAYIWAAGLGTSGIVETMTTCEAHLVPVVGPEVDKIVKERPYYVKTEIPANTYPDQAEAVSTFGYNTCLVGTADLPDDLTYYVVKAVFDNFEQFKQQSSGFKYMTRDKSVNGCMAVAPTHPGALRFYKEMGLVK